MESCVELYGRVCGSKLCSENKRNWVLICWGRDIVVGMAGRFGVQTPPDWSWGPSSLLCGDFPLGGRGGGSNWGVVFITHPI